MFFVKKTNVFLNLITVVFTVTIFFWVVRTVDLDFFVKEIKNISFFWLFAAYSFLIFPKLLIAFRWKIIINDYKLISLKESFKLQFVMDTFSVLVPFKAGDFINAFYQNDEKYTLKTGISASIFEKTIDFIFILLFATIGSFYFLEKSIIFAIVLLLFLIFLFFVIILLFLKSEEENKFLGLIKRVRLFGLIARLIKEFFSYLSIMLKNKKKLAIIFAISFVSWILLIFQGYFIFKAIGVDIELMLIFWGISIGILIAAIPVTFLGVGTRDATFVFLFSSYVAYTNIVLFGILFTLRYIAMAILGLFWMNEILKKMKTNFRKQINFLLFNNFKNKK